ncbi:MAG: DUF1272 domain-containing protein [Lacunisphaera sp.]|nr:DUF1272 domain-containing protein [Lacunisphaera sp.]
MALELRPNCECCDRDLPPASKEAVICTYECTFCLACATKMRFVCPNCGGDLVRRPIRPAAKLVKNQPSTVRVYRDTPRNTMRKVHGSARPSVSNRSDRMFTAAILVVQPRHAMVLVPARK